MDRIPRSPAVSRRLSLGWHGIGAFPVARRGRRREKIPLLGDSREATWALRRDELLREQNRLLVDQNRLLAGLPPLPVRTCQTS
jgi:hypothetical protein